ncbi:MAG: protein rep, partial [Ruthenibacterium sp.]
METMEHTPVVKEITKCHMGTVHGNVRRNEEMVLNYLKLLANGIVKKRLSPAEIHIMRERKKRLENCNRFWSMEIYEASHVKVLLRTFLCKDKFCSNCNQVKKLLLQNRFLPYMERYKNSLYHMVLTVPDCTGEELKWTIQNMSRCFKTLVTYLNGNKKVKEVDLIQYGFQGCIRSLEISYKGDAYHPHFHVAAVLGNGGGVKHKYISNQFSGVDNRLFSDFEVMLQRIWWLLINQQRLTAYNILGESNSHGRYSCIADKFQPEDYKKLFGYMTKMYSEDNSPMRYENFKTLYDALS